jgi:hypothetical protein
MKAILIARAIPKQSLCDNIPFWIVAYPAHSRTTYIHTQPFAQQENFNKEKSQKKNQKNIERNEIFHNLSYTVDSLQYSKRTITNHTTFFQFSFLL